MSKAFHAHKAGILTSLAAVLVVSVLGFVGYTSLSTSIPARPRLLPPNTGELRLALHRAGLDAEALAACGVSAESVPAIVSGARSSLGDSIETIRAAESSLSSASKDRDNLLNRLRTGRGTQDDQTALTAALSTIASSQASLQTALDNLFSAGAAGLSTEQRASLNTVLANRGRHVPPKYLTASRDEAGWRLLTQALANDRVATRTGTAQSSSLAQALEDINSDLATATAASNLQSNLAGVTSAWDSATQ